MSSYDQRNELGTAILFQGRPGRVDVAVVESVWFARRLHGGPVGVGVLRAETNHVSGILAHDGIGRAQHGHALRRPVEAQRAWRKTLGGRLIAVGRAAMAFGFYGRVDDDAQVILATVRSEASSEVSRTPSLKCTVI
jgi:hypothetical protein